MGRNQQGNHKYPDRLKERSKLFHRLSPALAQKSTSELLEILQREQSTAGWGTNQVIELNQQKIFVKKIPLTDLELQKPFDTSNHFELPVFYHYGVGSAGFGAWRELLSHIKTCHWVLTGECESFPLLYHYRIIEKLEQSEPSGVKVPDTYCEYWASSTEIMDYIKARDDSMSDLVLFLEYIPYTVSNYLVENQHLAPAFLSQLKACCDFLEQHGMKHFDAHLANILCDGAIFYLGDFGLMMDESFHLDEKELEFFKAHDGYDFCEVLACFGIELLKLFQKLGKEEQAKLARSLSINIEDELSNIQAALLEQVSNQELREAIGLSDEMFHAFEPHLARISYMREFFTSLKKDQSKSVRYESCVNHRE